MTAETNPPAVVAGSKRITSVCRQRKRCEIACVQHDHAGDGYTERGVITDIDEVGPAAYIQDASQAGLTLFIWVIAFPNQGASHFAIPVARYR